LGEQQTKSGRGFRVYNLSESNFQNWEPVKAPDSESLGAQLSMYVDHIREGRTEGDILYELLLKSGFPLSTSVEKLSLAGRSVYSIGGGVFLVCLDKSLTLEVIREMAAMKPSRVVCLDAGFAGDDQLKVNAVQTFKTKGVVKFQTV
jgi:adenine-specific DNA-methyltransferase